MARSTPPHEPAREPLRLMEASLHDGGLTLTHLLEAWRRAVTDAQSAANPLELGAIQWRLATEQAACMVQAGSAEFDRWFGTSTAALLTQTPRVASEVARRWGLPVQLDAADDVVYAPLAAVENMRSAWSHAMRQWAETLRTGAPPA